MPVGAANDTWCIDFKGWWRTLDGQRCDPLTLTDAASRFVLCSQLVKHTDITHVRARMECCFREFSLPTNLRSDNGPPFASTGFGGLSRLAVWWIQLGIRPERIEPGKPQQNGQHERMHLTLQDEVAQAPARNPREQQRALNLWREEFNEERPHEALDMQTPASCYAPSARAFPARLAPIEYPDTRTVRQVRHNGEINWEGKRPYVSEALAGRPLSLEPQSGDYWRVYFSNEPLGLLHARSRKLLADPNSKLKKRSKVEAT